MEHTDTAPRYLQGRGVEIGAFKTPIPGIKPVYVDRFAVYANERTHAEYYGDACDLPFHDSSLQYVASSHVLEHVANPLAALAEWFRVLEHGGCIYMVVPDRRSTFDHRRPLTEVAHMLDDYRRGTTQSDATHLDDFVYGIDWRTFSPATDPANEKGARDELAGTYRRSVAAGLEINIHFHTFETSSVIALIETGNRESIWGGTIRVVETAGEFPSSNPNGFLVIARVHKRMGARWKALWSPKGLRADARRF
jgi:SAM-dependent methyltransferase